LFFFRGLFTLTVVLKNKFLIKIKYLINSLDTYLCHQPIHQHINEIQWCHDSNLSMLSPVHTIAHTRGCRICLAPLWVTYRTNYHDLDQQINVLEIVEILVYKSFIIPSVLPHPVAIAVVTLIASLGHKHAGLMNLLNLFVEINKQKLCYFAEGDQLF
jgi:hypothetical protein